MEELNFNNEPNQEAPKLESPKSKSNLTEAMRKNPWMVSTVVLGVLSLILLVGLIGNFSLTGNVVSEDTVAQNLLTFYEANGAAGLELESIEEVSGVYKINFLYNGAVVPMFATKDGKFAGSLNPIIDPSENQKPISAEVPKSDKPIVELFVMSFCPYGNKAEDTMLPVYNLLKDKVEWNIHYIVSVSGDIVNSLHGPPETDQDIREVCVLNKYGLDEFWAFTSYVNQNCGSDGSCWEDAAQNAGIDKNAIQSCYDNEGIDLMKEEAEASNNAGANGSPTFLINGVKSNSVYQYGNSEAYKQAICEAFNDTPNECSEELSGSTSTSSGGSC